MTNKMREEFAKALNNAIRELEQDMNAESGEFDCYFAKIFDWVEEL